MRGEALVEGGGRRVEGEEQGVRLGRSVSVPPSWARTSDFRHQTSDLGCGAGQSTGVGDSEVRFGRSQSASLPCSAHPPLRRPAWGGATLPAPLRSREQPSHVARREGQTPGEATTRETGASTRITRQVGPAVRWRTRADPHMTTAEAATRHGVCHGCGGPPSGLGDAGETVIRLRG